MRIRSVEKRSNTTTSSAPSRSTVSRTQPRRAASAATMRPSHGCPRQAPRTRRPTAQNSGGRLRGSRLARTASTATCAPTGLAPKVLERLVIHREPCAITIYELCLIASLPWEEQLERVFEGN